MLFQGRPVLIVLLKTEFGDKAHLQTPFDHRVAITWAQRLKRVFAIDVETCSDCGGDVQLIASIAKGRLLLARTRQ